jgi:hypothetical protein
MARNINADGGDVFRAVITSTPPGKPSSTWHEGPYAKPGAARARVSFWRNHLTDDETGVSYATGHIEKATTVWERI